MQIHEITLKNKKVNEGILGSIASGIKNIAGGVADVAARGIEQKYGGQQGQYTGAQQSASTAQAAATATNAPLVDRLAKSLMQTYKRDVGALIKSSRDPNTQAQATSATNLDDKALMLPLQQSIARSLKFDYTQLPGKVDPNAFNGKGKDTAMAIKNSISQLITGIAAHEKHPDSTSSREQMRLFTLLAQEVSSAQSMSRFQGDRGTSNPKYEALLSKVQSGVALTPAEQTQLNTAIKNGELNVS